MNQQVPAWMWMIRIIDAIGEWSGNISCWLIIPLVGGLTYEVIARYVFNAPTEWAYDTTYMLYGAHFMLGAGYTLLHKEHIRTDLFYEKFTPRNQGIIDATLYLFFFFPGMIFFCLTGWEESLQSWYIGERSDTGGWRPILYPFKMVVPVAAALLILQGVSEFVKSTRAALTGRWPS